jgi:hypothetical protein
MSAVKHVWRYLYGTKHMAIGASEQIAESSSYVWDKSLFYGASDAAFADDVSAGAPVRSREASGLYS